MADPTRRDVLLAAAALPSCRLAGAEVPDAALHTAARRGGRFYGAAVQVERVVRDPAFGDAVLRECGSLTPELEMKWAALQPEPGRFVFQGMDALADFARRYGRRVYGHTLLWYRSVPNWAGAPIAAGKWSVVHQYIEAVMTRYADVVDHWDVVNEPVEPLDGADGLRRCSLHKAFGSDYIRRALDSARAVAPGAGLNINEYGVEYPIPEEEVRRRRLLRLVDELRGRGAPLDGVGIQAHLRLDRPPLDQRRLASFLEELAVRGLSIFVTELDVREAEHHLPTPERDRKVADAARAFLEVALDQPAVRGITTWGLSDRYSWLNHDGESGAGKPGGNRGLPLDRALRLKPLHGVMAQLLRGAASTKASRRASASELSRTTEELTA